MQEAADILLVGDSHLWQRGAAQAGQENSFNTIDEADIPDQSSLSHLHMPTITSAEVAIAEVSVSGGTTSLRFLDKALDLAVAGLVDGVLFAPFNKASRCVTLPCRKRFLAQPGPSCCARIWMKWPRLPRLPMVN
ncbi:MAG: 4-hydroxythreonine-4-phosphate dehydrogenase PdxA [Pseudomonadota bacterium]